MKRFKKIYLYILMIICLMGILKVSVFASKFPFNIYVNGNSITLKNVMLKDGRTYVQLRELAEKMDIDIEWVDFHSLPIPGGNLLEGINLNQSNVLNTKDISGWFPEEYAEGKNIYGIEMTSLIKKYNEERANKLDYYFKENNDSGLYIRENGKVKYIPIQFYNYMGLKYATVDDFKEKIQPYFVDICLQK